MIVHMFMAISLDGFIATKDGGWHWVQDTDSWEKKAREVGHAIMGTTTYKEVGPMEGVQIYVMTNTPQTAVEGVEFVTEGPVALVARLKEQGIAEVLLSGGGFTNGTFAQAGLIDKASLSIHPLLLGEGVPVLGAFKGGLKFKLEGSSEIVPGVLQNSYTVVK